MTNSISTFPAKLRVAALAAAALLFSPSLAIAVESVRIEPGTVMEITAIGVPGFKYRVAVNANGQASFPLLDPMNVSGRTLDEIRDEVRSKLPHKIYRQRTADGKENYFNIAADEITLDIAEYRPVYINGDVGKPGELSYRPGLTVRQAIALAGGFDLTHTRLVNPFLEAADFRSQYDAAWLEFVQQQALLAGLNATLRGEAEFDIRKTLRAPLSTATLDRIAENETAHVKALHDDYNKELDHIQALIKQTDAQVATLRKEQKAQQDGLSQQASDLDRIRELYRRNVVPVNRISDEQRQFSYAQERVLAVTAQVAQAMRLSEEARRKLEAAPDRRRIKLLGDIQDATVKLATLRARIEGLDQKLVYVGEAKSQLTRSPFGLHDITIHRRSDTGMNHLQAGMDDFLQAGDVVEIALKPGGSEDK